MKRRELQDYRKKSISELRTKVAELKLDALRGSVQGAAREPQSNVKVAKLLKRDIAWLSSIIREQELLDEGKESEK